MVYNYKNFTIYTLDFVDDVVNPISLNSLPDNITFDNITINAPCQDLSKLLLTQLPNLYSFLKILTKLKTDA